MKKRGQCFTSGGFTLIEILVVLLIIGISAGIALLAFGDFGASRKATVMAEQFSSYVRLVQHRAILEMNTMGIRLDQKGYETFRFERGLTWQQMPKNSPFRWRPFPKNIIVTLKSTAKNKKSEPDIIINSSGDMTQFILYFGDTRNPQTTSLTGQHDGDLILHTGNP